MFTDLGGLDVVPGVPTYREGTDQYERATAPQNALIRQAPGLVAVPQSPEMVAVCLLFAREHGLVVVPQATGHGAARRLGANVLLVDTSGLDSIDVDAAARKVHAGAGVTWGAVGDATVRHGLFGRAGSAPDVGITGFTFGAGAGWLTRPWGLASSALRSVDYVDGHGAVRVAHDAAEDPLDRDVIWACRGGGGVGFAVALSFDLVPVANLWAGYLLWPLDALGAVVDAWCSAVPAAGEALNTSLAVLRAPASPAIPETLHGQQVVHLSMASAAGPADAESLRQALTAVPAAAIDTWGPSDLNRLNGIHLDPTGPVPALGVARWLNDSVSSVARRLFEVAADTGVVEFEIRNVAHQAPTSPGALNYAPGSFMMHAVGVPDDGGAEPLERDFDLIVAAAAPADTGIAIGSWSDGRASLPDGLPADVRRRVTEIADRVDPDRVIARSPMIDP